MANFITRREFFLGTLTLLPLAACTTGHMDSTSLWRQRICSSNGTIPDTYKSTCNTIRNNYLIDYTYTLINYAGYYLGSIFGDPILQKRGNVPTNSIIASTAQSKSILEYGNSIEPQIQQKKFDILSKHVVRDVMASNSANYDIKNFISSKERIRDNEALASDQFRYEKALPAVIKTAEENKETMWVCELGYTEIGNMEPKLKNDQLKQGTDNLARAQEENAKFIRLLKMG